MKATVRVGANRSHKRTWAEALARYAFPDVQPDTIESMVARICVPLDKEDPEDFDQEALDAALMLESGDSNANDLLKTLQAKRARFGRGRRGTISGDATALLHSCALVCHRPVR